MPQRTLAFDDDGPANFLRSPCGWAGRKSVNGIADYLVVVDAGK